MALKLPDCTNVYTYRRSDRPTEAIQTSSSRLDICYKFTQPRVIGHTLIALLAEDDILVHLDIQQQVTSLHSSNIETGKRHTLTVCESVVSVAQGFGYVFLISQFKGRHHCKRYNLELQEEYFMFKVSASELLAVESKKRKLVLMKYNFQELEIRYASFDGELENIMYIADSSRPDAFWCLENGHILVQKGNCVSNYQLVENGWAVHIWSNKRYNIQCMTTDEDGTIYAVLYHSVYPVLTIMARG